MGQLAESYDKRDYDKAQLPFGYARASTIGALINVAALLAICLSIALTALVRFWKPVAVDDLGALVAMSAKRRRGDVVAAARRVLKRFAADEHTYVEVVDAAGGSPKSVITQSRRTGPMFSGIACRPCK